MGLNQSDAEVLRQIYADPNFKGLQRPVRPVALQAVIRQLGYTEEAATSPSSAAVGLRRQIAGTVSAGVEPSKA